MISEIMVRKRIYVDILGNSQKNNLTEIDLKYRYSINSECVLFKDSF